MKLISCEKLEKSMVELQFSIDAETFKSAVNTAFKREGKKYAIPGFRKGKAPKAMIEKMYGKDLFQYDAVNDLFPENYEAAVKEAGIEVVGRPEPEVVSMSEEEGATLKVKVAVKPEVELGEYTGLTVNKDVKTVDEADVDAEIKRMQDRNGRLLTREGEAQNGDTVDIDFEGFVDGVALLAGVNHEQRAGELLHLDHAAQILLQLGDLAQVLHDFLLGQHVEGAVLLHGLQLVQPVHTSAHGLEVGHHAAQPPGIHIELAATGGLLADGLLCLLLGAHEQQGLAALRQLTDEAVCLLQLADGLLQVHNIDAVALRINIGSHLGVPTAGLVTEMDAGFQHLLHANVCHGMSPSTWGFASTPALTLLPVCVPRTHAAGRNEHPRPLPECA